MTLESEPSDGTFFLYRVIVVNKRATRASVMLKETNNKKERKHLKKNTFHMDVLTMELYSHVYFQFC